MKVRKNALRMNLLLQSPLIGQGGQEEVLMHLHTVN